MVAIAIIFVLGLVASVALVIFVQRRMRKMQAQNGQVAAAAQVIRMIWLDVLRVVSVLVTFCQIATSLPDSVEVEWPSQFTAWLDRIAFVNFDFLDLTGVGCGIPITHANKLSFAMSILLSLVCIAVLSFFVLVHVQASRVRALRPDAIDDPAESARAREALAEAWEDALGCAFDLVDNDGNGKVDANEMVHLLDIIHAKDGAAAAEVALKSWAVADTEGGTMANAKALLASWGLEEVNRLQFVEGMAGTTRYNNNKEQQINLILWSQRMAIFSSCTGIPTQVRFLLGVSSVSRSRFLHTCACARTHAQLAFILHSPISRTAFQWFRCRQIGDKYYVEADFSTVCWVLNPSSDEWEIDAAYQTSSIIAGLIIMFFSLGLPIAILSYLGKERSSLRSPRVVARVG